MNSRYKLKITGKNTKRFINDLIQQKVLLYDISMFDKYVLIVVDEDGYAQIKKVKTSYKIEVVDSFGKAKIIDIIKKYRFFLIFLFVGILIIKLLSSIVFDIDIEHSKSDIREIVLNDLNEYGIAKYHFKVSYKKKEEIIRKILKKETERIEWLEIDSVGTKYVVKVEERVKNNTVKSTTPQNIIAKKDAMVLLIHAENGEVKAKKYQYVKKGDVLISGFISKDDKIVKKERAEGYVFGEVWYQVQIELPKVYKEELKTGKKKNRLELYFFDKNIFLFNLKRYKNYKISRHKLIENKIFPVGLSYSTIYETKKIEKDYSNNSGLKEAIDLAEERLLQKLGSKDEIISKNVLKKSDKNSKIVIDIFFKVKEDITDTENIENINIEELEGAEDGTSN